MKRYIHRLLVLTLLLAMGACGTKNDPDPQLPGYLRIPVTLTGYVGSGLINIDGDLKLRAEGPEAQDAATKTYSGVSGRITLGDIKTQFTVGQPLPYSQNYSVPAEYNSNGQLLTLNALQVGTYPMGYQSSQTPTGAQADLILNLPGPQLYSARLGNFTIAESTVIKSEGSSKLYRIQGTFQTAMTAVGTGTVAGKDYNVTGSFDLLLVD